MPEKWQAFTRRLIRDFVLVSRLSELAFAPYRQIHQDARETLVKLTTAEAARDTETPSARNDFQSSQCGHNGDSLPSPTISQLASYRAEYWRQATGKCGR